MNKIQKEDIIKELKILTNKIEKMRNEGYSFEQYREYWKKVLEILDSKGDKY